MKATAARVGIVGAGVAGFSLAHRLGSMGLVVAVVDKSRGPGGRCATRQTPAGAFDHGPGEVQARDTAFIERVATLPDPAALGLNAWARRLAAASAPAAVPPPFTRHDHTAVAAIEAAEGGGWWLRTAAAAAVHSAPAAAAAAVHSAPAAAASAPWAVPPADAGFLGPFDAVVVATPAEQARTLLQPSAALQRELQSVRSQPCWTVMAAWPGELPNAHRLQRRAPGDQALATARPMTGAPTGRWVLQATAEWSEAQLDAQPAAVVLRLLEALSARAGVRLAPPAWSAAHRWRYAQVAQPLLAPYGWDADLQLASIGDAWAGGKVPGESPAGIERAWNSAQAFADAWLLGALKAVRQAD